MTVYTHSFDTEGTSSVIDKVYYNDGSEELYVQLFRTDSYGAPVIAGYAGVPEDIYRAMELINFSRVQDGNYDASVGSYWNIFVKPNFTGIDTAEVDFDITEPDDEVVSFFTSDATDVEVEDVAGAEEVKPQELYDWTLAFDSDVTEGEFALRAASLEDAIERFEKIAEIAGLTAVYVISAKVDLY